VRARTAGGPGAALAGLVLVGAAGGARAAVVVEAIPTVSAGVTDNALAAPTGAMRERDEFGRLSVDARIRYDGLLVKHALGYRLGYTKFLTQSGADSVSNALSWQSGIQLSGTLLLTMGADGELTRTTVLDPGDFAMLGPQAMLPGPRTYLSTGVREGLTYQPTANTRYLEGLSFRQVRFLGSDQSVPTTTTVSALGRGEWIRALDTFSGEADLGVNHIETIPGGPTDTFASGNVYLLSLFAGWLRTLSPTWSTELQVGPVAMFKANGTAVIAPGGRGSVNFRRLPWYASLIVSQTPEPNIYLGEATISDRALARIALPLTQRELVFITGSGGYTYARVATQQEVLQKAFDQWGGAVSLTARLPRLPFWGAVEYLVTDQHGATASGQVFPSMFRQDFLISIGGMFVFGPGEPPIFRGVL